jgi:hypothetical protein
MLFFPVTPEISSGFSKLGISPLNHLLFQALGAILALKLFIFLGSGGSVASLSLGSPSTAFL